VKFRRSAADPAPDLAQDEAPAPAGKGRPTPKRRDSTPQRGPVSAPKNRKEAYSRRRDQDKAARQARRSGAAPMNPTERRAAYKAGDPAALPRKDQGPTRKIARDFVDSRRLLSNYMLLLFPLLLLSAVKPFSLFASPITLVAFAGMLLEWYICGRKVTSIARERGITPETGTFALGFYCGNRAFLPRRWRLPAPQVQRGDKY
jgi:hypothetical protein